MGRADDQGAEDEVSSLFGKPPKPSEGRTDAIIRRARRSVAVRDVASFSLISFWRAMSLFLLGLLGTTNRPSTPTTQTDQKARD